MKNKMTIGRLLVYIFVIAFAFMCLYPFLMVIGGSFMTEAEVIESGYRIIPKNPTLASYKVLMANGSQMVRAYVNTIVVTAAGTCLSVFVNGLMGYVLSRRQLAGRRFLNMYVLLTMLFNGGMVTWYITCTQYLHLKNSLWALILPGIVGAWNIYLIRNYFAGIPEELWESARLDGASEFRTFGQIYLPLGKPVLATVVLFAALGYWNDWWRALMLIDDSTLYPLQMLLRVVISNIQYLQTMSENAMSLQLMASVPGEGVKMALVVVTTGPIILLYPFVQKYFVKGIMVGAVKG